MSAIDDGGPAFPSHGTMGEVTHEGMSLRDRFATEALPECIRVAKDQTPQQGLHRLSELFDKAAVYAYFAADAMLKARNS